MPYKDIRKRREYLKLYRISRRKSKLPYRPRKPGPFNRPTYMANYYQENKERLKETKNYKEDRMTKVQWFKELKRQQTCSQCPESDPRCLDFHHVDPSQKSFIVSTGPNRGYSKERILEEITKCVVLCSNCHRKYTFKDAY